MRALMLAALSILLGLASPSWAGACTSKTGVVVFLDFNNSVEEVEGAQAETEAQCKDFKLVRSRAEAESVFKELDKGGRPVDSMIFSGHSGEMGFEGSSFQMNAEEIVALVDAHPNVKKNTRDIYLWGCYTNNIEKLEHWIGTFDNVDYVFGFNNLSPLSRQMTGAEYLARALKHRSELSTKESVEEIKKFLDTVVIPGQPGFHFVNAAIYGKVRCEAKGEEKKEFYYEIEHIPGGTETKIGDYSDFKKNCGPAMNEFLDKHQNVLKDYWSGKSEILDINHPDSKNPAKNPVRKVIYPWSNKISHCFKKGFPVAANEWVGVGQILNLVYFHTIMRNFFNMFDSDIAKLKDLLGSNPDTKNALELFQGGAEMSRQQAQSLVGRLQAVLGQKDAMAKMSPADREFTVSMVHRFKRFVRDLDSRCADIKWIEEKNDLPQPSGYCMKP